MGDYDHTLITVPLKSVKGCCHVGGATGGWIGGVVVKEGGGGKVGGLG